MNHQLYADDTQVYLGISLQDATASMEKLKLCLNDIKAWVTNAKLKLNPSKTELLLIGTKQQRKQFLSLFPTSILDHDTSPASSARNIGVTFDSELKFDHHIRQICKSCFYHIRDLRRIRRHLSMDTAKMIANSLVTSRLDYCNSLLFNVDDKYMKQLERVQNSLARVVCKTSKFCHITPVLHSLHWFRIKYWIDFKINTLVYKTLHTNQPVYLRELLSLSEKQRTRASGTRELIRPRSPKTKAGSRAFYVVAPYLWNSLPAEVRTAETYSIFRKKLKTHFFASCFPS